MMTAGVIGLSAASQINLPARKDRVIPVHNRVVVLDCAETYLSHAGGETVELENEEMNPFSFDKPKKAKKVVAENQPDEPEPVEPEVRYNYSDESILKIVSRSLSKQVTGTMARGTTRFLQLKGGKLLKPGATFPARLPELKDKVFKVAIDTIDADGYTLKLNSTTYFVAFEPQLSGATKDN